MKKDIHPQDYRLVVFHDTSSDFKILTRSTATTSEKIKWEDGKEYPLIKVHVSSASHPFYTGEEKVLDIEGRVDKFKARTEAAQKAKEQKQAKAATAAKKAPAKKSAKPAEAEEKPAAEPAASKATETAEEE